MDIRIARFPDINEHGYDRHPGRKAIVVDGVRWGRIEMTRHGVWGTAYTFHQEGEHNAISRHGADGEEHEVEVRSEGRRAKYQSSKTVPEPIEKRLLAEAKALVNDGLLRNPEIVRTEQEAFEARRREQHEKMEATEAAAFEARARDALKPFANSPSFEAAVADVIAAMRWAQTQ